MVRIWSERGGDDGEDLERKGRGRSRTIIILSMIARKKKLQTGEA